MTRRLVVRRSDGCASVPALRALGEAHRLHPHPRPTDPIEPDGQGVTVYDATRPGVCRKPRRRNRTGTTSYHPIPTPTPLPVARLSPIT